MTKLRRIGTFLLIYSLASVITVHPETASSHYFEDTGADVRLAAAQAVLDRNQASLQSIPGYGSSYVADDPTGRLGPDGQPIAVIVIWIDDVTNPANKSAASKAAPSSLENIPVDVRFASTNRFDTEPSTNKDSQRR